MTYYMVVCDDTFSGHIECFWTDKGPLIDLFLEEYPDIKKRSNIYAYEECKSKHEFFDVAKYDSCGVGLSEHNELFMMVSDHDPSVYHITSASIQEDLDCGGMTDAQYQSTVYNIVKSAINLTILSDVVKDSKFKEYMTTMMLKYVSQFILLNDGTIEEYPTNLAALKYMNIDISKSDDYIDGVLSIVDYVMFAKMCEGYEP